MCSLFPLRWGKGESRQKRSSRLFTNRLFFFPPLSQPGPEGTRPNGGLFARAAGAVARPPQDRPTAWGALPSPPSSFMGRWELAFYQANSLRLRPSSPLSEGKYFAITLRPSPESKSVTLASQFHLPRSPLPSVSACPTKKNARMEGPFIPPYPKKLPAFRRLPFSFLGESGLGGGQQQEWQKMRDQETHGKEGQGEGGGGELLPSIFCPRSPPPPQMCTSSGHVLAAAAVASPFNVPFLSPHLDGQAALSMDRTF